MAWDSTRNNALDPFRVMTFGEGFQLLFIMRTFQCVVVVNREVIVGHGNRSTALCVFVSNLWRIANVLFLTTDMT